MLEVAIPDVGLLRLEHLVLDFNGTLARDGALIDGVADRIGRLSAQMAVHVVTGDTFGNARAALAGSAASLRMMPSQNQAEAKRAYLEALGRHASACIGNGANDQLMMQSAALAIAVIEQEGAAVATLQAAGLVVRNVLDAFDLLLNPLRLVATLRR
ncbi:MAG TPA: hypothetical protein VMG60_23990 [Burkholderiaceae bacterium]|nr:hypothetical protein [Burkholderiaceae bacterium]